LKFKAVFDFSLQNIAVTAYFWKKSLKGPFILRKFGLKFHNTA